MTQFTYVGVSWITLGSRHTQQSRRCARPIYSAVEWRNHDVNFYDAVVGLDCPGTAAK